VSSPALLITPQAERTSTAGSSASSKSLSTALLTEGARVGITSQWVTTPIPDPPNYVVVTPGTFTPGGMTLYWPAVIRTSGAFTASYDLTYSLRLARHQIGQRSDLEVPDALRRLAETAVSRLGARTQEDVSQWADRLSRRIAESSD
jgi:hypothetical protein